MMSSHKFIRGWRASAALAGAFVFTFGFEWAFADVSPNTKATPAKIETQMPVDPTALRELADKPVDFGSPEAVKANMETAIRFNGTVEAGS